MAWKSPVWSTNLVVLDNGNYRYGRWFANSTANMLLGLVMAVWMTSVSVPVANAACLSPPGDFTADGATNILDLQCQIMAVKTQLLGQTLPDCFAANAVDLDLDCNQTLAITDVQLCIILVLGPQFVGQPNAGFAKWPVSIDADNDYCADACNLAVCLDPGRTDYITDDEGGCSSYSGFPVECLMAYQNDPENEGGTTTCYYNNNDGQCAACDSNAQNSGWCGNTCAGPVDVPQCLNADRTIYLWGNGIGACQTFNDDPAACEMAYHVDQNGTPAACSYQSGNCNGVGYGGGTSSVINDCVPTPLCEQDSNLTTFVGGPNAGPCGNIFSEGECNLAYHVTSDGVTAPCFWDTQQATCYGCGGNNGASCVNTCQDGMPICENNPQLEFVQSYNAPCSTYSGDFAGCVNSFGYDSQTGLATSCYYNPNNGANSCQLCDSTAQANGYCANSCVGGVEPPACEADQNRTIYLFGNGIYACQVYNGDQASCEQAYHWDSGAGEVASCYYSGGSCNGCGFNQQENGNCTNACDPPATCDGDPGRTLVFGTSGSSLCGQIGNEQECEGAYHLDNGNQAASCFWDALDNHCYGCGNNNGYACLNTCIEGNSPPSCDDNPGLVFTQGYDGFCSSQSGSFSDCMNSYGYDPQTGQAASCYYNPNDGDDSCQLCDATAQANGYCANSCGGGFEIPVCEADDTRTIYLFGNGINACHVFNGDQGGCEQAYHWDSGSGEVASCYYDGASCQGCGQNQQNNANCINTCDPPPVCEGDPDRTLLWFPNGTLICGLMGNEQECEGAYHIDNNDQAASCFWDAADNHCYGCGNNNGNGCLNTCVEGNSPPSCNDNPGLVFTQGYDGFCSSQSGSFSDCMNAYGYDPQTGQAASCYYNPNNGGSNCQLCDANAQANGSCANSCVGGFEPPVCEADDSRTTYVFGNGINACHVFDGDQGGCEQAYHWDSGAGEPASCYFDGASCNGCGQNQQNNNNCSNTCNPPPTCDGDSNRTLFVGGPNVGACGSVGNQSDCDQAYHLSGNGNAASCYWDQWNNGCFGCGSNDGTNCVNTCNVDNIFAECADHPEFVYAPGNSGFCSSFNDSPIDCLNGYGFDNEGTPRSCHYMPGGGENLCTICSFPAAASGQCANWCFGGYTAPTCDGDSSRTLYLFGNGNHSCSTFNGDPAGCAQAYHFSFSDNAVSSCHYDNGFCVGCGTNAQSTYGCTNLCAAP